MHHAGWLWGVPKPLLILGVVLMFWWAWPIGLAAVAFLAGTGRLGRWCDRAWAERAPGRWYNMPQPAAGGGTGWGRWCQPQRSGNAAFDEYRMETLRRLEDEQKEFEAYLERLRSARDKAEFDQFMAERGRQPPPAEQA